MSLQRTFATLQPKIDAFQLRFDAARYKAEAGLSRRGFIPSGGTSHSGVAYEEKEGLMGMGGGHHLRGRRAGSARGDPGGVDDPAVDSSDSGDDDDAWQRSKGMGGVDRGAYMPPVDEGLLLDRTRSSGPTRGMNVFDEAYGDGVGMEQDNLKWPAGEGWKPL